MKSQDHLGQAAMRLPIAVSVLALVTALASLPAAAQVPADADFHDSHFHLTNYIQEGTDIHDLVEMMGGTIGRSTVFGLPLQQMWSYGNTGDFAPTYYLQTDAPLYYYSFTDAHIAMAYRSLTPEQQARFDPMITGFNPADMYAADHIRRVLLTFPGVFSGIGEFTIHKEFVSAKVAGDVASLTDPALDRIFDFAAEAGLVVILHNDINMPFPKPDQEPYMLAQMKDLFVRHPDATIIWAHLGVGRVVRPLEQQAAIVEKICTDPALAHVYFDISWDEVAKYVTATPEATRTDRRHDQPLPRPLPLRHRRRGAELGRRHGRGLRRLRAAVGAADTGGELQGAQGQLRDGSSTRRGSRCGRGRRRTPTTPTSRRPGPRRPAPGRNGPIDDRRTTDHHRPL